MLRHVATKLRVLCKTISNSCKRNEEGDGSAGSSGDWERREARLERRLCSVETGWGAGLGLGLWGWAKRVRTLEAWVLRRCENGVKIGVKVICRYIKR